MTMRLRAWLCMLLWCAGGAGPVGAQTPVRSVQVRSVQVRSTPLEEQVGNPASLVGCSRSMAYFDFSGAVIRRLDAAGRAVGRYARHGGGPGELRGFGGMQLEGNCRLWIADAGNSKVMVLDDRSAAIAEFSVKSPVEQLAPLARGTALLAVPNSVMEILHLLDARGNLSKTIPFPEDLQPLNPIVRSRYLARVNDSLALVQFRWYDRRLLVNARGVIVADFRGSGQAPKLIEMSLGGSSRAYRVDPASLELASGIGMRGDTLLVIRGQPAPKKGELQTRSRVLRILATTGRVLDELEIPVGIQMITATARAVYGIGETEDGYALHELRW